MNRPEGRAHRPRPRAGLAVQLGQTLFVLGVAVLVFGLLVDLDGTTPWIGAALGVVGAVLFLVGLRRRPREPDA